MSTKAEMIDPFHPLTDQFLENPYPVFAAMRDAAPISWSKKAKNWYVTSYEIASEITRDLRFEKRLERWNQLNPITKIMPGPSHLIKTRQHWMINENPPEHTHLRTLVNKAFSPRMIEQMKTHIQDIAESLVDAHASAGKMEFIGEFAYLLPIRVICEMLGIPPEDNVRFREWSHQITETLEDALNPISLHRANKAHDELVEYLKPVVAERRKTPRNDLISALVQAEEDGSFLNEADLIGQLVLLLVAGHETTVNLIGNGMLALLRNPEQLALLKKKPELIDSAIEEFLRYDSPVQFVKRLAGEDMEFHGQKMQKGDMIIILLGACNHDPEVFDAPDKLNIERQENKHLAFSSGIHHCLGASLARMEGKTAIGTILRRLPHIQLGEQKLEHKHPFGLRGLKEMHVVF